MRQCFIISLPRAGSTLLQRLLATHPEIQTVGEPWVALPFAYALRVGGVVAEYNHHLLCEALGEFIAQIPGGKRTYFAETARFIQSLQQKIALPGKTWFVDKTPRYHLILDELAEMFPDAKFIVLYRNPLAVVASILNTWKEGRFSMRYFDQDIFRGPRNILQFVEKRAVQIHTVRFEDLAVAPDQVMKRVTDFLEVTPLATTDLPEDDALKRARFGDKTGIEKFKSVSATPVSEWTKSYASPLRRAWARKYLRQIGPDNLRKMGYDAVELRQAMKSLPWSWTQLWADIRTLHIHALEVFAHSPYFPAKV
ncbi:MAG TPA: sulfotransferase [Verrucomicrobiae bacterium]